MAYLGGSSLAHVQTTSDVARTPLWECAYATRMPDDVGKDARGSLRAPVEAVVEQDELRAAAGRAPHEHVGGVRVAVDVAEKKDHLAEGLRDELCNRRGLEALAVQRRRVGDADAVCEFHGKDTPGREGRVHGGYAHARADARPACAQVRASQPPV